MSEHLGIRARRSTAELVEIVADLRMRGASLQQIAEQLQTSRPTLIGQLMAAGRPDLTRRRSTAETAEDALWLHQMGETWPIIAERLGITLGALSMALRKSGHPVEGNQATWWERRAS